MENILEVMRIKRIPPMGKLVIEVGNQRFDRISQIQDEVIKQLVVAAIGELIVFADGYQTLADAGVAPPMSLLSQPENRTKNHRFRSAKHHFTPLWNNSD